MAKVEVRFVEASRFHLQEGDTILLRIPDGMDLDERVADIAEQVRERFPGHPIVVLAADVDLQIVRSAPGTPAEGQLAEVGGVRMRYTDGAWAEA